ncbi:PAS domain S-box protein [Mucilaginibacter sp. KACC 22063]|uniref:PAS domain S-box protein n=1 Tax=Mucilaginibacter sp. KACC 22063 TaxID=3025666 RepID=UPI002366C895|nr:PAS domain S-box protein [Mucilaginibacter sp. KACC 22063]WDF55683.1 PAS domain S-box protein [Mucilaginibacter sp. KACC 22063]
MPIANNQQEEIEALRSLIEETPDPVGLYVGREMRIQLANKAIKQTWGKWDVVGKTFREVLPELDEQGFYKLLDQVYTTGELYEAKQQEVVLTIDGVPKLFYFDFAYTPLKKADGTVWAVLNTAKDLTELVLARQRLSEAEARTRFVLDSVGIGSWDLDVVNRLVWWDDRCRELFGLTNTDIIPYEEVFKFIHHADRFMVDAAVNDALNPAKGGNYNVKFRTSGVENDKVKWLHCQGKAYFDAEGKPYRFSGIAQDITEAVASEEKIRSAEQLTQLAIEAAGAGTFFIDMLNNEMIYSPSLGRVLGGLEQENISREQFVNFLHPDDTDKRAKAYEEGFKTGKLSYEARFIWKDGSIHWVKTLGSFIFDPDGNPVVLMGVSMDITTEIEQREEQERLLLLIENTNDFISLSSPEGFVTYVNKAGLELLGFENIDEAKRPNMDYIMPDELPKLQEQINPSLLSEGQWSGHINFRHFVSKEPIPGYGTTFLLKDRYSDRLLGRATIFRDLRSEMASQKALAESEQLFRGITTASPAALWMSDDNAQIIYVNKIWIDWTGVPLEGHLGEGWLNYVMAEDVEKASAKFLSDFNGRKFHESHFRIKNPNGTERWVVCTGNPQYNSDGRFTGYIGACVDITDQKQLQQQKDEFIGIASHELKTPVTSIKAYSQVLEAMFRRNGDEQKANMVLKMNTQIDRLTNLISDLLDVTKIQSGRLQFNHSYFNFDEMITELIEDLQRTTQRHKIKAEIHPVGEVYADRDRISQVIVNLITNAIKYSPDSEDIIVKAELNNKEVEVCVQDFGIGIDEDKQPYVFEQFYRVSGDKQHTFPGLGLGLYISSEIIKREGGRIWVNSVYGKGSTFCFSLSQNRI